MHEKERHVILILTVILALVLTSCGASKIKNDNSAADINHRYSIDFLDAETFENALNNGEDVVGKTVRFYVNKYEPKSELGINCWAGEHLNFISHNKLDICEGEYVTGIITEKPSKFLGSWKISYEVIAIDNGKENMLSDITEKTVENKSEASSELEEQMIAQSETAQSDRRTALDRFFLEIRKDMSCSEIERIAKTNGICISNKHKGASSYEYRFAESKAIANENEKGSAIAVSFEVLKEDPISEITYFNAERMIMGFWTPDDGYSIIDLGHPELIKDSVTSKVSVESASDIIDYTIDKNNAKNLLEILYASLSEGITKDEVIAFVNKNGLHYNSRGVGNEEVISYCSKVGEKYGETGSYIIIDEDSDGIITYAKYYYYPANFKAGLSACFYSKSYAANNSVPVGFVLASDDNSIKYSSAKDVLDQLHK